MLLISIVIGLTSISGLVVDSMNRFLSVTCHFINIYIRLQGFIIIMYSRSQCVAMHFFTSRADAEKLWDMLKFTNIVASKNHYAAWKENQSLKPTEFLYLILTSKN